jgi:hypothetical protein
MMNFSQTKNYNTWEEVFYDYVKCPGWNQVRIRFNGITYSFSQGDFITFTDKTGKLISLEFPDNIETMMDAHVLENGMSPRELMRRKDLEYFEMD